MTVNGEDFAGARVRYWRQKRGLSQQVLAGLCGLTQGYISQIESGLRAIDKRSTLVRLADALRVSVADLTGQPYPPESPHHARALTAVPDIRAALIALAYVDLPAEPSRPMEAVRADVRQLMDWRRTCEYANATALIPGLLRDLGAAANSSKASDRDEVLRLLTLATYTTAFVLRYLGFVDLSLAAAERCHAAAIGVADPEWTGLAEFSRLHTLPPESRAVGRGLAAVTADALQGHLDRPEVRQVYGMLHLTSAWADALAGSQADAEAHLAEADEVAASLGDEPGNGGFAQMFFGPTNIKQWRASIARECGDAGKAVALASQIDPRQVHSRSRLVQFHIEYGCALAAARRHDAEALVQFVHAERVAPQRVRLSPVVRDTIGAMLRRARADAGGTQLRELAGRIGVA
ncbi:MAG TPA: helix-turn-helix transcriptional regulator [Micromonosporaceae bacterium]|nr:helix-turn-helix transcriptional regulator [Micromonosporaceae bacterium]